MSEMKCKRCGTDENRIDGFCSIECRDAFDYEEEIAELQDANTELHSRIAELEANLRHNALWQASEDAEERAHLEKLVPVLKARIAELGEKQRWIPVSERLPEDGKPVWVCTIWNEQHSGFLIDGVWGGLFRDFREGEITYWMSLPPNPESPNDTQTQTIVYGKDVSRSVK